MNIREKFIKIRIFKITFILIMFSLICTPSLYAKKGDAKVNLKGFSEFVERQMKEWKVVGTAVAIVKDGKIVYARGFGYRDLEKKLKVTPNTLFAIGSCTKAFTATLLGILVDEGKLEWNKPVKEYLPLFKLKDPVASQHMTVKDLLTHRSGLPRHDWIWYNSSASREELFKRLQYLEPSQGFRSKFQYNNLMFMAAGYLAGKIEGTTWEKLIQKKIFEPLGMNNCNFSVKDSLKAADYSLPYSKHGKKPKVIPFRNVDTMGPAGSINASVNEIAKWIIFNLNKGKVGKKQIISKTNLQKIHSPQMVMDEPLSDQKEYTYSTYGMGWGIRTYRGHPYLSHSGGIDGFSSDISFFPRENAGVAVITNYRDGGKPLCFIIRNTAFDRILGKKQILWDIRIKQLVEKSEKAQEEAKKKKKEDRVPNTKPSHKLEDYTGDYKNPGYGIFTIKKDGDQLKAIFNGLTIKCQHFHYDIFELFSDFWEQKRKATFHTDVRGNINKVSIPLQPGVKDIVFTRIPEKKLKDRM